MGRGSDSVVIDKSKLFAIRIVKLYKYLSDSKSEFVMSKQLLRSGTSIGANLHEAKEAFSKKDFFYKTSIALKEARETEYWLWLLCETNYISKTQYDNIYTDCSELISLLVSITKNLRAQHLTP